MIMTDCRMTSSTKTIGLLNVALFQTWSVRDLYRSKRRKHAFFFPQNNFHLGSIDLTT